MKNKQLTTEQKLNELIKKALSSILNRTASKTLATLIKKDPQLKRSYDKFFDSADEMKRLLAKKYGKDSSNYKALYPNG